MKFPYLKQPNLLNPQQPWISRPIIPIRISHKNNSLNISALIDSGADFCLFHSEIGRRLDIEIEKGKTLKFFGIEGSPINAHLHLVKIQVIDIDHSVTIPIAFTESPGVVAILGQLGFFDNFRIKFEKDRNIIEVTPVKRK
ncbi:hypothetical protein CO053_01780 [Candidatus Shapirobacteria bacterium CG_4_9_14_0_2_um_filter_40_11]|uniref:Peptidase A2 domain-containing protein n=1 Tax=Candidatus Shapirobacteria bacterium CG_4_9_14_0_2_um_filter_40_11 TaxID=1974876 RepID=A0A2M8EV28_9BACT|nr:MAG: hypothetical protein CO053_01780 [Candidatus Shapirobacteria bacterium CG_4_9_14_0_2_um_filter_40_11]